MGFSDLAAAVTAVLQDALPCDEPAMRLRKFVVGVQL
jgi:hypothetical protein